MITAATRLACLLGHPVAHSVSPQIHNAAFLAAGVDAVYLAFDIAPARFADALHGLVAAGLLGANVTVPHKRAALELAQRRTQEAEFVGAANTLFFDGDTLVADNTDASGLQVVLERDVGLQRGEEALLYGAGGAARAAAVALGRVGAVVTVSARRRDAAEQVQALALAAGATPGNGGPGRGGRGPRLVVNATPLGLHGEPLPPRFDVGPGQVALDLVYGPQETPFIRAARTAGGRAFDGLGMLLAQAALAFERWTGAVAPVQVMEAAARAALGERRA